MNPIVYVKVPVHIRLWAYRAYGNPIVFPAIGNEVAVIRKFVSKPPQARLSPAEQESKTDQLDADTARLHQSAQHVCRDKEYEEGRWVTHPDDYIAIELPDSKAKPVREYCYLGPRARRAVKEMVTDLFKMDLWASLKDIADRSCRLSSLGMVRAARNRHRIRGHRAPMLLQNARPTRQKGCNFKYGNKV